MSLTPFWIGTVVGRILQKNVFQSTHVSLTTYEFLDPTFSWSGIDEILLTSLSATSPLLINFCFSSWLIFPARKYFTVDHKVNGWHLQITLCVYEYQQKILCY